MYFSYFETDSYCGTFSSLAAASSLCTVSYFVLVLARVLHRVEMQILILILSLSGRISS